MSVKKRFMQHLEDMGRIPKGYACGGMAKGYADGGLVEEEETDWDDDDWNNKGDTSGTPASLLDMSTEEHGEHEMDGEEIMRMMAQMLMRKKSRMGA